MREKLLNIGESLISKAETLGSEQTEAYLTSYRLLKISVEKGSIRGAMEKLDAGCGIRSVIDKKVGFSYVTTLDEDDLDTILSNAVKMAKVAFPDPHFRTLPSFSNQYPQVKNLYDSVIEQLTQDEAVELILRTVDGSKEVLKNKKGVIGAEFNIITGTTAVINSLGISQWLKQTYVSNSAEITVKNADQASSWEFQSSRHLENLDPEWVGRSAAQNALNGLGAEIVEGGTMPVLLDPMAVGTILGRGFVGAINAQEIQYGRSYIADALGDQIASEELQIVDNGILDGGLRSSPFDGEGYPHQLTEVLTEGVLKNILHSSYTANKEEVENTGNASRSSYTNLPSIAATNFIIKPDKGTQADLISEVKKGIFCRFTGDRPNMTTGDLSAMVMEGYYIENGEIKCPVKNTLIGINMLELLQRIHRVGADTRTIMGIISPSLIIESAKITSG